MNSLSNADFSSLAPPVVQPKVSKMHHRKAPRHVKEEAARRVVKNGESVAEVATDIGYSPSAVNNWASALRKAQEDESELQDLRKIKEELERELSRKDAEIRRLEIELEFENKVRNELMQGIIERR